jgi:FtsH-binding integral membrane protein
VSVYKKKKKKKKKTEKFQLCCIYTYFNSYVIIIIIIIIIFKGLEVIKHSFLLTLRNFEVVNLLFNYLRQTYCHTVLFLGIISIDTQNIVFPEARDTNIARNKQMIK